MQKIMRPERGDLRTAKGSRSYSISSEVSSLPGQHLLAPPASINPEPAYVAISAASQLVSSELEIEEVTISASALAQLNSFLDHILFNILLAAKSTKLSLLRPAIVNVLKPKLGKAATSGADEELREYLGDEEDENEDEDAEADPDVEIKQEFDLELAWKLARLRCMVYSRLGDLEEDDEDEYIERENLDERGGRPRRFSSHPSRVSTASAIFLTSVIEFLAEQALAHAAQATQRKLSKTRVSQDAADPTGSLYFASDRIVVSDADMRQLGRDSPLQKLWRGWRHQVRSPTDPSLRSMSPESFVVPDHGRKASMGASDQFQEFEAVHRPTVAQVLHEDDPASVPLPMTDNDIEEIEIPESASTHDNEDLTKANGSSNKDRLRRPKSFEQFSSAAKPPIPVASDGPMASVEGRSVRPAIRHVRSRSLPTSPSLRPTTIRNNVPTSDSNGPESQIPESQIDSNEAEAADIEQPSIGATLQEPFDPSRDLTGGDGLSGGSLAAIAMPGSFPQGITADTDEGEEGTDISEESVDHYLPDSPSVSPIEPSADEVSANAGHVSTAIPSAAKGSQESNTISLVQSGSTNPPRVSSKDSIDNTSRRQLLPSALPDSVALIPGVVHGNHAKAVPSAPLGSTTSNATDTPDGNFPGARNMGAQKRQGQVIFPLESKDIRGSESSKSPQHSPNSSSSSKLLGFDREQHSAAQIGSNRAGVKRIYPVADTEDGITQFNRPSTSHSIKEQRPDSASSRYSSSIRGISARASLDTAVGTGQGTKASMEDEPNQSLDNLIRSKDTLKYTLTPQSVRQVEVPASPRHRTQTQELADFFRNTAPPGHAMPQEPENKPRSPIEEMNGLRANPPGPIAVPRKASASVDLTRSGGMERQTPTSPPSRLVRSPYQPRDAKVERPSTRDLADFAKSTGPEVRGQLPKPVSRDSNPPRRAKSVAPRFQARDPVVKGPNSDLIDFIREGPPRPLGEGAHRIPRVVAPFRTTMDSDELLALEPPQDHTGRNSGSSYQDGSIVTKSTVNSRTGLIDSKTRTAVTPATTVSQGASSQAPTRNVAEPTQPKRKQRRLRDPYAIDMESDDEIDDGLGKPPKYEEESLIDFLRNTSPPPESQFQPQPLLLSTTYMAAQAPNVLKKPANGGFRERLKRTASTSSLNRITGGRPSQSSSSTTTRSANNQVRPSSPHLVQSGSRLDSYKPTQSTYAAHVDRNRQKTVTQSLDGGKVDGSISKFFTRKRRIAA